MYRGKVKALGFNRDVHLTMNGHVIDIVESWAHLGHICADKCDNDERLDVVRFNDLMISLLLSVIVYFRQS